MSIISLIIKREFIAKVRNKSFIVMTFLSPLLFVGMAVLVGYLSTMNKDSVTQIAIHDEAGLLKKEFKNDKLTHYTDLSAMPFKTAKDTASNSYEGLIFVPKVTAVQELKEKVEYISEDSPSLDFISDVEEVIDSVITQENLKVLGFDAEKIDKAKGDSSLKLSKFSGEESLKGLNEIKVVIGGLFGYLIMMFIVIYGNFVMRSVIEEKTNRIIEIIISSVQPFKLMMGKIIGTSLAGILQFLIWIVLGGAILLGTSFFMGGNQETVTPSQITVEQAEVATNFMSQIQFYLNEIPLASILVSFVIFFIGGYFLYSSFYAAIGAAVDSETDSQQFLMPIIMPLMLAVYVGFLTVIKDPHGTVAVIFSLVPLTSPIVMLMRIPFGVPLWQLAFSIVLLYGTFIFVVWFAAKIYRVGILMYGKKPTWKELYKWLKY
mgnify:CR=1 FL=1